MFTREERFKYEVKSFEKASDSRKKVGKASKVGAALKAGAMGLTFGKALEDKAAHANGKTEGDEPEKRMENSDAPNSDQVKKPKRRRSRGIFAIRMRTNLSLACAFIAHVARRSVFVGTAHKLIFGYVLKREVIPTAVEKSKAAVDAGSSVAMREGRKAMPYVRGYRLPVSIAVGALLAILLVFNTVTGDFTYYEYSVDGKVLGLVRNEAVVYATVSDPVSKQAIDDQVGAPVVIDGKEDIGVRKVLKMVPNSVSVDSGEDIIRNIATLENVDVIGHQIESNGVSIGVVAGQAVADDVLKRVTDYWLGDRDREQYDEVGFTETIAYADTTVAKNSLATADEMYEKMIAGAIVVKEHKLSKNETLENIMSRYGITEKRVKELNPDADLKHLKKGVTLKVEEREYPVHVMTSKAVNFEEEYEETPIYHDVKNMYEDEQIIVTKGAVGFRKVAANEVSINGGATEIKPISYDVVKPAVAAHVKRGTRKLPPPVGIGKFVRPVNGGAFTSGFGPRWGTMHKGIDIGIKYAPIYAAGSGKVVYTGNKGDGYGIKVVIDHGDGFETLYGHLSATHVNIGDQVYKGQRIATSGNTGDSTGPHLHFEVRENGVAKNPLYYL